jgi:hypothetical protein
MFARIDLGIFGALQTGLARIKHLEVLVKAQPA